MSQEHADLNGVLGIGQDAEGRQFYVRIAAGELTYDRGGEAGDYIQVYLFQTAAPGRSPDTNDMFETDELDELAAELRMGVLDWYGERLEFRPPTADERHLIRTATGWK